MTLAFATANVRRAQAEAEAANAAKSKFLRTASHELRTPLAVIVWLTELLRNPERVPPERFVRSLAGIRRSAEELLRTTEAVLDLSRFDHPDDETDPGRRRRRDGPRGAGQPTAARRTEADRLAARDGAGRSRDAEDQRPALPPIVINLVANAIKFTVQGEVVVRVQRADGALALDVEDTGIGIPRRRGADLRAVLPGQPGVGAEAGGLGVGLALAKLFVEKLKGNLWLVSSSEGKGSTFRFTLPLDTASGIVEVAFNGDHTPILPVRARPLEGLRVLVADDEELMLAPCASCWRRRAPSWAAPPTARRRWRRRWRRTSRSS